MAKRRKHSSRKRGGGKCPEPFNTLIDIAGAMAMGAVASHMDKKHNYSDRGKINPYSVSALGIASGRIKNTNDIIRTGAMLGALGAFDDDSSDSARRNIPEDPIFSTIHYESQITETVTPKRVDLFADDDFHVYVYCLVKLPDIDAPVYYRTENHALKRGDYVTVPHPDGGGNVIGEIVLVEHHMRFSVPVPVEETDEIVGEDTDL